MRRLSECLLRLTLTRHTLALASAPQPCLRPPFPLSQEFGLGRRSARSLTWQMPSSAGQAGLGTALAPRPRRECRQRYLGLDSPRAASSSLVQPSPLTGRAHVFTLALLTGLQLPFGKGIKHSEMFRSFPLGPFPQKTCTLECAFNGSLYSISHHLRAWNSGPTPKWLCLVGRKMRDP